MAFPVNVAANFTSKDYIVAFGHLKLIRNKNNNGRNKRCPNEIRKKTTSSKLSKNINSSIFKKHFQDSNGQTDIADAAGTSNQTNSKIRLEHLGDEDYKRSIMLQRNSNTRKTPTGEMSNCSIKSITNKLAASNQQKNIQRVQLLNVNPDFCREVNSPPKSVASTRPIPTLGQIYQQDPSDDPLMFAGWYLESVGEYSNSFENSVETTSTSTNYTTDACIGFNENGNCRQLNNINTNNITDVSVLTSSSPTSQMFKTTNENVSEWLSAGLDHPSTDYHPLLFPNESPLTICYNPVSNNNYIVEKNHIIQDSQKGPHLTNEVAKTSFSRKDNENSHFILNNQPTIIIRQEEESNSEPLFAIPKTNTDVKEKDFYPDFHKPLMFHSSPVVPRRRETLNKNRTASYVDYPSEVLQKTTNFESDGGDNLSSIVETDRGLSSSWMFNRNTDSSTLSGLTWSKLQISQETFRESFKNCRSWKSDALEDKRGTLDSDKFSNHDYLHHYCWRKEVARKDNNEQTLRDYRGRCNKCHKYRSKKKGPLRYLRKRMAMGICRHRLNRVWKKTAAKWANWSKSASKFRRMGMMNYLQKSIIWDNANVQTTIFVYHETGTDAVAREQKSAEITASIKLNSCSSYQNANNAVVFGRYQSKPSSRDLLGGAVKEIRSINTQCSHSFEGGKIAQELVQYAHMKHAVSRDAYTQVLITCNNADTNIMFKPTLPKNNSFFSQGQLYKGVDAATDPIAPFKLSQRSINVMTSTAVLQGLTNNETQVWPAESIWKMSTGVLVQEMYRDAKSSVVTDTSVPRRILDATLITANGKVLTCTGTKITSVSSADIRSPSILSRASRPYTINTAISKVVNKDRSTTLSLCNCDVENACMATESQGTETREKSTSQMKLVHFTDIGVSPSSVVHHTSISCGSPHTSRSFGAATRPQCHSAIINTDTATVPKYTSVEQVDQNRCASKMTRDCNTQYSSLAKEGSLSGGGCQIGGSRLISVRALLPDVVDDTTQATPSRCSAETKTLSNQKISASILTSQFALEQQFHPLEATLDRELVSPLEDVNIRSDHNVKFVPPNKGTGPVPAQVSTKPSKRSNSSGRNIASSLNESKPPIYNASSHLDAKKWIKESAKNIKDIDSIVKVSENAIRESLHRASLIATSSHKLSSKDIRELSKALLNQRPDINCVSAKPYELSTNRFATIETENKDIRPETKRDSCQTFTIDKKTSDELVLKDTKESILQAQTDVCDTATDCMFVSESASVQTSRHVLPRIPHCVDNSNTDCLFVYDRPRCIIHNNKVNIAVQIQTEKEKNGQNGSSSQHSIAIEALLPCQVCCQRQHGIIGETLTPREYKSLYEATRLITNEGSDSRCSKVSSNSSSFDRTVVNEETNKMTSQMTSCLGQLPAHCCCMRCTQMQIGFLKDDPLLTGHTNTHSIQTLKDSFLLCPKCETNIRDVPKDDSEQMEDCVKAHLATSCRYYSNLLTMKLGRVRDNFIKHLAPSIAESLYPLSVPEFYAEACTMKPSGRLDENCQTRRPLQEMPNINKAINSPCVLTPTISAMDLRGRDRRDLEAVYYILSGIEGRVRRLKNNLRK